MFVSDIPTILSWWFMLFCITLLFLPFAKNIFTSFFDKGYIFVKIIGSVLISYFVFIFGVTHILPFTRLSIFLICITLAFFIFRLGVSKRKNVFSIKIKFFSLSKSLIAIFFLEELLFLICLFLWSYIRGNQPDIHGLEKFMDYGFVNSILRSEYFPPKDMWFTPFSINYYYFGHFITAVLTKLSSIPSSKTYNLMLATLFALGFTSCFSIGANLLFSLFSQTKTQARGVRKFFLSILTVLGGILSGLLAMLGGNLHVLYIFFTPYQNEKPLPFSSLIFSPLTTPNSYWYPNATRFIYNTIHEFPIYSFVVSDLHGHVVGIAIVLTIVALLLHEFILGQLRKKVLVLIAFLLACAYMTNAWDGAIYLILTCFVLLGIQLSRFNDMTIKQHINKLIDPSLLTHLFTELAAILLLFLTFSLPFSLSFKPFVSGIGILCAPEFLTNIGKIGPFLFEANHCQKSPLWQLLILYGHFYFFVLTFIVLLFKVKERTKTDIFVLFLIITATLLLIVPEFIYFKDIYPAHYRANTMFKLSYEAFMMLSLVSAYTFCRLIALQPFRLKTPQKIFFFYYFIVAGFILTIVLIYPYFAIMSYYENLKTYKTIDGTKYLNLLYPEDADAIRWLNSMVVGQPVILEAQGDSYTDYARISANTGLPTVLGWTVHEWLWRGTYDIPAPRIGDVKTLYETPDITTTKKLLKKYNITYIMLGTLERQKYPGFNEKKLVSLGTVVFTSGNTKIYKITPSVLSQ